MYLGSSNCHCVCRYDKTCKPSRKRHQNLEPLIYRIATISDLVSKTYVDTMRSLALALSWMAFGAIGTEASPQFQIPPEQIEQICRENERSYAGPPMPRVSEPIFSGSGCPSQGQVGYNYRGLWSCHRKSDVQFLIPGLNIKAEKGKLVKAECAITFRVDDLGPGWQVALDEGIFDADVEMAPRSEIRAVGAVDWEGGPKTVGTP